MAGNGVRYGGGVGVGGGTLGGGGGGGRQPGSKSPGGQALYCTPSPTRDYYTQNSSQHPPQ